LRPSPFAKALVKHLSAKGRNLQATMIAVRKDVVAATEGKQVPWDHSAMTGDFYFVPGDAAPAAGTVSAPGAGSSADVAALQERLKKLEDDAKTRASAVPPEDMMKLAELRARAASLSDLVKDLQRKVLDARMKEGRASNPEEKNRLVQDSMNVQMEWTRRGLDLKKLKEEIAEIEGPKNVAVAGPAAALPVIPNAGPAKTSPNFEMAENVALSGSEIRSFRAPNPVACREACDQDASCAGFQHGRKNPVMGTCRLFSHIEARHQDGSWLSGLKKKAAAAP
jgi:hypothetical protein